MKKVLAVLLVSALIVSSLLFVSCERDAAAADRDHLIMATSGFPSSMDPTRSNDVISSAVNRQFADTLVIFDGPQFNIVPHLATSWEFEDPQTLIMHLRRGVRFHNGDLMRASDVKFSLERAAAAPVVRFLFNLIRSVDVIDDYTVRINLYAPHVPFVGHLAHLGASILPERVVREMGDDFANHPIGTGPFMIESVTLGQEVRLVRFPDYS